MPVTVVVGGQFGSEGKGKVALHWAKTKKVNAVVRVGGPNSGHTGIDEQGNSWIFRQLPASSLFDKSLIVLPAGSLIDPDLLLSEIESAKIDPHRIIVDANASIVTPEHRATEVREGLISKIGSTASGTGASMCERISRAKNHKLAVHEPKLKKYIKESAAYLLRDILSNGGRVLIEGTQGFGLSVWHGGYYPYATSRDTTASGFVAESGLAPHDVDEVVMVIRTFPIRVSGNSGPLDNEIGWRELAQEAGLSSDYVELTSATKKIRRVARFDPKIVKKAILSNAPHRIVLNHVDYLDTNVRQGKIGNNAKYIIESIERDIGQRVDFLGTSPNQLLDRSTIG